jgi:hypothetical protein
MVQAFGVSALPGPAAYCGTDVMHDVNPAALLREMAHRRIAVEISLSSSDVTLGVRGSKGPCRVSEPILDFPYSGGNSRKRSAILTHVKR